jgi:hypothetical protein
MSIRQGALTTALLAIVVSACSTGSDSQEPSSAERELSASSSAPPLEEMILAQAVGKIGAPVDVRYQISGVVTKHQPVTVQLAFVPRVDGSNLRVEFPESAGLRVDSSVLELASPVASKSDVMRHEVRVTPSGESGVMRAIVSMELDGGRYFSIFAIPVGAQPAATTTKRPPKG